MYKGVLYDSKSEAAYAAKLDAWKRAGIIVGWERQVDIPLVVNGKKVCKMVADFLVDGEYVEVKGVKTAAYNIKLKLLKALYPDIRYRIVPAREALK